MLYSTKNSSKPHTICQTEDTKSDTGRARLIQSHSSERFCIELGENVD